MDRETGFVAAEFDRALNSWCSVGRHQDAARVRYVARLLRERGAWPELVGEWTAADRRGDADAAWRMGWVLHEQGDQAGSERAFDRAVQRGHLATLSKRRGERARAGLDATALNKQYERALRRRQQADQLADQRGDAEAAYRIGFDLIARAEAIERELSAIPETRSPNDYESWRGSRREHSEQARELRRTGEAALYRAAERGSADADAELGELAYNGYSEFPESDAEGGQRALSWCRRADELGHPASSWRLGNILKASVMTRGPKRPTSEPSSEACAASRGAGEALPQVSRRNRSDASTWVAVPHLGWHRTANQGCSAWS